MVGFVNNKPGGCTRKLSWYI